ncbi:hypothetical protein I7I53_00378 [Histoplasma capsulatum var. duboisii H88]|uniref:Uncharacterized protein n=1 Tax=Ajellomyces capsulatus (strain H88) TaxID=544711 RepID=A0A8A1LGL8_AJEC8|nr:hypothetical protein I7I53_00378 [Histoplasma capsulatum var. duboisii H88]
MNLLSEILLSSIVRKWLLCNSYRRVNHRRVSIWQSWKIFTRFKREVNVCGSIWISHHLRPLQLSTFSNALTSSKGNS